MGAFPFTSPRSIHAREGGPSPPVAPLARKEADIVECPPAPPRPQKERNRMRFKHLALPLALSAALVISPVWGAAVAHAEEIIDTEAVSEDLEEQIENGQEVEEQVQSLSVDSTAEEVADASASVSALGRSVGSADSLSDIMSQIDLGPSGSVQLIFAQLQIAQAEICKNQAESNMAQIESIQREQQECAEMIERARTLQNEAQKNNATTAVPDDMLAYFAAHDLYLPEGADTSAYVSDDWDFVLKSLTNYQESIGDQTQTLMVSLQDFIGQYNSYLQTANAQVKDANQALGDISLGQTMLGGEGGTGMLVTGLLGGAAAGIVGTLLVTRAQARKAAEKSGAEGR